jgi:hypothetical protein
MSIAPWSSLPHVLDVHVFRGAAVDSDRPEALRPDLLIEIPHGATETRDFDALAARLVSPLPEGLVDFFHVNTDTGAPELAIELAARFVRVHPDKSAVVMRCRIPRTFVDVNRRLDASAAEYKAGGVAPGLMPWVTDPSDLALCRSLYDTYTDTVRSARDRLAPDGAMLLLHTYAPRTVGVEVDLEIVKSLHHAYAPEVETQWPVRHAMDIISRDSDGVDHAPPAFVAALTAALAPLDLDLGRSHTYPLHPSTMGWEHVMALPDRCVCLEVRRDLFVRHFQPFAEARILPERVASLADPVALAVEAFFPRA